MPTIDNLTTKKTDYKVVCNSNIVFLLTAIYILQYKPAYGILFALVGYCSHKHHSNITHLGYRILDWLFAIITFIIFTNCYYDKLNYIYITSFIVAICFWFSSSIAWSYGYTHLYSTLHSLWHIIVCLEAIKLIIL